jgi:ABC-type branched-subunit amino acid transport system ATPase component
MSRPRAGSGNLGHHSGTAQADQHAARITIVLITHEMNVIKSICDRVAVNVRRQGC